MAPSAKLKIDTDRANTLQRPVDASKVALQQQLGIKGQKYAPSTRRMPAPEPDLGRAWAGIQNSNIQHESASVLPPYPPTPSTAYLQSGYNNPPPPYSNRSWCVEPCHTVNTTGEVSNISPTQIYASGTLPEKHAFLKDDDDSNTTSSNPSQLDNSGAMEYSYYDEKRPAYSALEAKEIAQHAMSLLSVKGVEVVVNMLSEEGIRDSRNTYTGAIAAQTVILKTREIDVQKANAIRVSLKMKVLGMFNAHWKLVSPSYFASTFTSHRADHT